jgi:GDP-L-fucose synthase
MKLLLTGANGLIGSTISADVKITGKEQVDLRNWENTFEFFKNTQPSHVIHCAGKVGGLGANMNKMGEFFYDNTMINLNVLEASRRIGVKKVISFLSTCIFPDDIEYPLTEDKVHNGPPHSSNFGYAYSKRMLEVHSRAIAQQYGLKYSCVIPTNVYGPKDNFNLQDSHVVPALIHKCYLAKKHNTDMVVWGSGSPLREFIYSEDVGEIVENILSNYDDDCPLIISNSEEISIKELVEIIASAMEFKGRLVFDSSKSDGQYRKPTSNSKLASFMPDFQFTSLAEGIKKTVPWFIENYESCRK